MIIIMGPVGSGKSEQTARLTKKLNCPRISTSQLLREHLTPEREAKMHAGELIADPEIIELLEPELRRVGADTREFILDGAPRSVIQAQWLRGKVINGEIKLTAVIRLKVPEEVAIKRLLERGRPDDNAAIIRRRLDAYHRITEPVVTYFESNGIKVHEINGEREPDEVESQIERAIK